MLNIDNGWYIAECTSEVEPKPRLSADTYYLPVGIEQDEEGMYHYNEYRFNLPVDYEMPREVYGLLCGELIKLADVDERLTLIEGAIIDIGEVIGNG